MKRPLRIFVLSLVTLALLAAAGLGVLLAIFNPNNYTPQLCFAVQKATGRELVFLDKLELRLFPHPELTTGRIVLHDAEGFGEEPFLAVDSASFILALEPLWDGVLAIEKVILNNPSLKLATSPTGIHNWQSGFAANGRHDPSGSARNGVTPLEGEYASVATGKNPSSDISFQVSNIYCYNARFFYYDLRSGGGWRGVFDSLIVGGINLDREIPLEAAGGIKDNLSGQSARFLLKAITKASGEGNVAVSVKQAEVTTESLGTFPLSLSARCSVDYSSGQGTLHIADFQGTLTASPHAGAGIDAESSSEKTARPLHTQISGHASFTRSKGEGRASLAADILLSELDLDALKIGFAPAVPLADSGEIKGAPNMPRAKVVKARRQGGISGAAPEKGAPVRSERPEPGKGAAIGAHGGGQRETLLAALSGGSLAVEATVDINFLKLSSLPLRNARIQVQTEEKQTRIPFHMELFNGILDGMGRMELQKGTPHFGLKATVKNLDLQAASAALSGRYALTGRFEGNLDISGNGQLPAEVMRSLAGRGSFQAMDGEVRGFSLIPPSLPGLKPIPATIPFTRISAGATVVRGVATTKNILLRSHVLSGQGGGTIHLQQGQMDLGIDFKLAGKPPAVPIAISGPYGALSYRVDMPVFMRNVAASAVVAPEDAAKGLLKELGKQFFR